jgi:predicted CXXCH cytochrome family protein
MKTWLKRSLLGASFAIPMAIVAFAFFQMPVQAQEGDNPDAICQTCHPAFQEAWSAGAHGQAASDPAFLDAWAQADKDPRCLTCHTTGFDLATGMYEAQGVTCSACHDTSTTNHPAEPMASDGSPNLCGSCHTETYFEWQISGHRQEELGCVGCHDPHATELKAFDESSLCSTCHRTRASNFAHTQHSQEGLTCADCHLGPTMAESGEGHAVRDHSFGVKLSSCNACHAYQMHDPAEVHLEPAAPVEPDAMASVEALSVAREPTNISPVGFAMLSGLVGMASGMILTPWLERWYQRIKEE